MQESIGWKDPQLSDTWGRQYGNKGIAQILLRVNSDG